MYHDVALDYDIYPLIFFVLLFIFVVVLMIFTHLSFVIVYLLPLSMFPALYCIQPGVPRLCTWYFKLAITPGYDFPSVVLF